MLVELLNDLKIDKTDNTKGKKRMGKKKFKASNRETWWRINRNWSLSRSMSERMENGVAGWWFNTATCRIFPRNSEYREWFLPKQTITASTILIIHFVQFDYVTSHLNYSKKLVIRHDGDLDTFFDVILLLIMRNYSGTEHMICLKCFIWGYRTFDIQNFLCLYESATFLE